MRLYDGDTRFNEVVTAVEPLSDEMRCATTELGPNLK